MIEIEVKISLHTGSASPDLCRNCIDISNNFTDVKNDQKSPINDKITQVRDILEADGFSYVCTMDEYDQYYNAPDHDFRNTGEAMRLRKSRNMDTGRTEITWNYKGSKLDTVSMTRHEYETSIGSYEIGEKILDALGFSKQIPVHKQRVYYKKNEISVYMDQVDGLGQFMEIEILAGTDDQYQACMARIQKVLAITGYTMKDSITRSYLSMLQAKSSNPDNCKACP
ncbi:MAG: class IV adenylate cyclase [Lachnospiraceae bacterium]|nr:class IV adenylate cyclase [Lachnospiraceae bacterium]